VARNERWYQEDFGMLKFQIIHFYWIMRNRALRLDIRFEKLWAVWKSINAIFRLLNWKNIQVVFRWFIWTVTPYLLAFWSGIFLLHFWNTYIRYWKGNHLLPMLVRHVQGNKRRRQYIMNYEDQLHIPLEKFLSTKGIRRRVKLYNQTNTKNDVREDIIRHWIEQHLDEWPEQITPEEPEQPTRERTTADLSREEAIELLTKITKVPEEPSLLPYLEFFAEEHSEYFITCFLC